jgi:aspartyl-tRNA(Asn)/glutamyl-tRNA(Gln) amidotransferase subunit C
MTIDEKLVDQLSHLARLSFENETRTEIKNDLNKMLAFVDKLNELDTTGVEPLIYMVDETNVMRKDVVKTDITHEEGLKNAPKRDSDYFRVPKVIG